MSALSLIPIRGRCGFPKTLGTNDAGSGYQPYAFPEGALLDPIAAPEPRVSRSEVRRAELRLCSGAQPWNAASSGTEELHLYWAKASTGLSWPTQWWIIWRAIASHKALWRGDHETAQERGNRNARERTAYVQAILDAGPVLVFRRDQLLA